MRGARRLLAFLVVAACGPDEPELTACQGAGEPSVEVGRGGVDDFSAWADGERVAIEQSGTYGFRIELSTVGMDTTSEVTLFTRYTPEGETESRDAGATVTLQCDGEGPGWTQLFVPLGGDDQLRVAELDGTSFELSATVTDAAEDTASFSGTFAFDAP